MFSGTTESPRMRQFSVFDQLRNPRFEEEKLAILGKMLGRLAALTPNHCASVAPYCEIAVVGIKVPLVFASLSLPRTSDGKSP